MGVSYDKKRNTYIVTLQVNGSRFFRRGFETKAEAEVFHAQLKKDGGIPSQTPQYNFNDVEPLYMAELSKTMRNTTIYSYKRVLRNHILSYFGEITISELTNMHMEKFSRIVNKKDYGSKGKLISMTRKFFEYCKAFNLPKDLKFTHLYVQKTFTEKNKYFDFYTTEEYKCFRFSIDDNKMLLLFDLLFYYGLRIGELRGLKHRDFDLRNKVLYVRRGLSNKTDNPTSVIIDVKTPLSNRTLILSNSIIKVYKNVYGTSQRADTFIFEGNSKEKKVIAESSIKRYQVKTCVKANMRVIKIHEFRHSCASNLIYNNFRPHDVAAWLGHSVTMTLDVYSHLFPGAKKNIADFFDK